MDLFEWTQTYIKYKDSVTRRILNIEKKDDYLLITNKDKSTHKCLCVGNLSILNIDNIFNERISTQNSQKNFDWILENWEKLKDKKLLFYFINLKRNECWALNPAMHESIIEKGTLKTGLKALFDSISMV